MSGHLQEEICSGLPAIIEAEKTSPEIARKRSRWWVRFMRARSKPRMFPWQCLDLRRYWSVLWNKFLVWKEQLLPKHPIAEVVSYTPYSENGQNIRAFRIHIGLAQSYNCTCYLP
jgi:hypothetical protein